MSAPKYSVLSFSFEECHQGAMDVLSVIECAGASIGIAVAYDWLTTTRTAAFYTDFDYRYFPPSKIRIATVLLLAAAILFAFLSVDPDHFQILPMVLALLAFVVHAVVGQIDISAQRRTGYRTPLGYGEREDV